MTSTKWSNFHVTVNLNLSGAESAGTGIAAAFAESIEEAINDNPWQWLMRFEGSQRPFEEEEKPLVESIRARVGMEQEADGTNRSIHAHILLEVQHRTRVQINHRGLKDFIDRDLGVSSNVSVRFLAGDSSDKNFILHYISKSLRQPHATSAANRRLARAMGEGGTGIIQPSDNDDVI